MSDTLTALSRLLREKGMDTPIAELAEVAGLPVELVRNAIIEVYQEVDHGDC